MCTTLGIYLCVYFVREWDLWNRVLLFVLLANFNLRKILLPQPKCWNYHYWLPYTHQELLRKSVRTFSSIWKTRKLSDAREISIYVTWGIYSWGKMWKFFYSFEYRKIFHLNTLCPQSWLTMLKNKLERMWRYVFHLNSYTNCNCITSRLGLTMHTEQRVLFLPPKCFQEHLMK